MVCKMKRHIFFMLLVPSLASLLLFTRGVASFPSRCTLRQTARGLPFVEGAPAGELVGGLSLVAAAFGRRVGYTDDSDNESDARVDMAPLLADPSVVPIDGPSPGVVSAQ